MPEPGAARLVAGRLGRLRRSATRGADDAEATAGAVPADPATVAVDRSATSDPRTIADLSTIETLLARHGHQVRVSDRTVPGEVGTAAARAAYLVLEDVAMTLVRRATGDQRVNIRIRCEGEHVVIAVQTLGTADRPRPLVLTPRDEDTLRRRIEGAHGRATLRTTHGGNWLAMARLPR
ncbi:hypothetical protein [Patulibacter minatonensis]|uniref:hypothetical protein n=1 Tax=Patulibacter minatonensis TaxID=298163 RepID=UPI00047E508F|nr:hypothetical protein [Patulibacter minatonensis]